MKNNTAQRLGLNTLEAGDGQKKHFFYKIVRYILNIPAMFGIIITTIENVECKIEQSEVYSLES